MGNTRRLAVLGMMALAAMGAGSVALALPASADGPNGAVAVSTTPAPGGVVTPVPQSDSEDTQESRKVKGKAVFDLDSGKWRAQITHRNGNSAVSGSYDTEEEAQSAANDWADSVNNGVKDGPGCDPPLVLC